MFTSSTIKDWLETGVALSVLIGIPVSFMHRYINSSIKDLRKEIVYDLKELKKEVTYEMSRIESKFIAELTSETNNRKESVRHSIDEALFCLDTQIENNAMKIEQLSSTIDFLKKETVIKEESFKDKYTSDINFIVSLIDSIESYLETKNGYRRRKTNFSNIGQVGGNKSLDTD